MDATIPSAAIPAAATGQIKPLLLQRNTVKIDNPTAPNAPSDPKLAKTCQDFEAVLVSYLLKTMRESVPKEGFLDSGNDAEMFQDIMDWEIATQASRQGKFGLWKPLYRQLSREGDLTQGNPDSNRVEPLKSGNVSIHQPNLDE
jgi:flagellar protein FlgJ